MPRQRGMTPEEELGRILRGDASLDEFFSDGEFFDALEAARWRVIRVFAHARTAPGRGSTPGYILGLDNRLTSLAEYVQTLMHERAQQKIYSSGDLPFRFRRLNSRSQQLLVSAVRFEIYMRLLTLMQEANDLWRMEGEWCVPQSVLDEYLTRFKRVKDSFRDDRRFHGRPRRDRDRLRGLRVAAGVSVGS